MGEKLRDARRSARARFRHQEHTPARRPTGHYSGGQPVSTIAIVMMIICLGVVWGGLAVAIVHLRGNPDETTGELGADGAVPPAQQINQS
nr:methionine/alanine import family NSS transporter small subunit [Auritidibacter ignavus]